MFAVGQDRRYRRCDGSRRGSSSCHDRSDPTLRPVQKNRRVACNLSSTMASRAGGSAPKNVDRSATMLLTIIATRECAGRSAGPEAQPAQLHVPSALIPPSTANARLISEMPVSSKLVVGQCIGGGQCQQQTPVPDPDVVERA